MYIVILSRSYSLPNPFAIEVFEEKTVDCFCIKALLNLNSLRLIDSSNSLVYDRISADDIKFIFIHTAT